MRAVSSTTYWQSVVFGVSRMMTSVFSVCLVQVKSNFFKLLRETPGFDRHTRWSDFKKRINSDPRYEAVESSSRREDWFKEYAKNLCDVSPCGIVSPPCTLVACWRTWQFVSWLCSGHGLCIKTFCVRTE